MSQTQGEAGADEGGCAEGNQAAWSQLLRELQGASAEGPGHGVEREVAEELVQLMPDLSPALIMRILGVKARPELADQLAEQLIAEAFMPHARRPFDGNRRIRAIGRRRLSFTPMQPASHGR